MKTYDINILGEERFLPLANLIDKLCRERDRVIIAIDGPCGSGKSTLGEYLQKKYNCNLFHMDDFFLQKEQRTPERLNTPGENVDHERFLEEVLAPAGRGETIHYRRFDCKSMTISPEVVYEPHLLTVIEGSYSLHRDLRAYYDLTVFLDISEELQMSRITGRNTPEAAEMFFSRWIPMENAYFKTCDIRNLADVVIDIV